MAFFVQGDTGDVLSILPYVSLSRTSRSSNMTEDENAFRASCASLMLWLLEHTRSNDLKMWLSETLRFNEQEVNRFKVIEMFRNRGMVDDSLWSILRPRDYGARTSAVMVCNDTLSNFDSDESLIIGLLSMIGVRGPVPVSVIQVLRDFQGDVFQEITKSTTEFMFWGLSDLVNLGSSRRDADMGHKEGGMNSQLTLSVDAPQACSGGQPLASVQHTEDLAL